MFHVIVNCGPCEEYVGKCLASLRAQSLPAWIAHVTVDPCGDGTYEAASRAAEGDARIQIMRNTERQYSMLNLVQGIGRSGAAPDDVVVILDGDDWFATPEALRTIDDTYRQFDCWMTYGSWMADQPNLDAMRGGRWPAYTPGTENFRTSLWLGTAVRTWKRWLWNRIDDRDFRDANGSYFRVTEDQAAMMPMLEMSGTDRARHISEILMVYNRSSPHACGLTLCEEMFANSRYLGSLKPYPRLSSGHSSAASLHSREEEFQRMGNGSA